VDVLETAIKTGEVGDAPLVLSLAKPGDLGANAAYESTLELAWAVGDRGVKARNSMAYALALDSLVLLNPPDFGPNENVDLMVVGPGVADLAEPRLRCPLAGGRADPLIDLVDVEESRASGSRVLTAGKIWFPVLTPPLQCNFEGRVHGWPIAIPVGIRVVAPSEYEYLAVDRAFISPGEELRVVAFQRDPVAATMMPMENLSVRGAWTRGASSRRIKEREARTSAQGATILRAAKTRLREGARFELNWRGNPSNEMSSFSLGGIASDRLDTRFPLVLSPEFYYPAAYIDVEVRGHMLDGSIPAQKDFTAGFYWGGEAWRPAIMISQMMVPGDGVWRHRMGFKNTLLWGFPDDRSTRGIALTVGEFEGAFSPSSWATLTYGPAPVWVRRLPSFDPGKDQFLMSRYDGSPLSEVDIALRTQAGVAGDCTKEDSRLWTCPSMARSHGAGNAIVLKDARGKSSEIEISRLTPLEFPAASRGFLKFVRPIVVESEPLEIEVHKNPRVGSKTGGCEQLLVLVGLDGMSVGTKSAWSRCLDADEKVSRHQIVGLSDVSGVKSLRALWFTSGGQIREELAHALVLPEIASGEMSVQVFEDRTVEIKLPADKFTDHRLLLWISDSMDPGLHDLRADHLAEAVMGLKPPEGHVVLTAGLEHPAGWISHALHADADPEALRLSLADGYALPVPLQKTQLLAAPGWQSANEATLAARFEDWLRAWSDRWDSSRKLQEDPAGCLKSFPLRAFQRNMTEARLTEEGVFDMRLFLRRGPDGVEGLNIRWFGPDGREGTADDLRYYLGVACGGASKFLLAAVRKWDIEPRLKGARAAVKDLVAYGTEKHWLSFMQPVDQTEWKTSVLHPGKWWVHAVSFEKHRLKFASVREIDIPDAKRPVAPDLPQGTSAEP